MQDGTPTPYALGNPSVTAVPLSPVSSSNPPP